MAKLMEIKGIHPESPIWIWKRIRAVRNYKAELCFIESCLLELKSVAELEIRKQKTPAQPS